MILGVPPIRICDESGSSSSSVPVQCYLCSSYSVGSHAAAAYSRWGLTMELHGLTKVKHSFSLMEEVQWLKFLLTRLKDLCNANAC